MGDNDKQASRFTRQALIVGVYLVETTLAVFAALAMFRVIAAENYWTIGINIFQVVFASIVLWITRSQVYNHETSFIVTALVAAILLVILRSVWQGVADAQDAELISEASERDLFMTYLGLAAIRLVIWITQTVTLVGIFVYYDKK